MSKKFFVVSDVHGHFTELREALDRVGFDPLNGEHVFVSCGDLFDRGNENVQIYSFVRSLERKILVKGNHDDMLRDILTDGALSEDAVSNGTDNTFREFFGENSIDSKGRVALIDSEKAAELADFLDSMVDYYEEGKYIFVHGWVPIVLDERVYPRVNPAWREAGEEAWRYVRWVGWWQTYDKGAVIEGKTIVCGHRPARMGRIFDSSREPDSDYPFFGNGVIAIDPYVTRSGRVEVLVLEYLED